jgi:hypothetical protein
MRRGLTRREPFRDCRGEGGGQVAQLHHSAKGHLDKHLRPLPHEIRRQDDIDDWVKALRLESQLFKPDWQVEAKVRRSTRAPSLTDCSLNGAASF